MAPRYYYPTLVPLDPVLEHTLADAIMTAQERGHKYVTKSPSGCYWATDILTPTDVILWRA